ncbi:KAT8 regulatory NSL complex subunit 3 isoform X5 [Oopsacas minuta]|uniref:KAT8 regulatory NSL complex subunit 3 isoform X5 n=1 Tax=Oopsacas minuta TaxID=111878 RepID=A0AAV7K3G9_9METZ|nr:KAT8 regulatory NSL complex subunit 3 isoform X5 [Oopsacas minuta]
MIEVIFSEHKYSRLYPVFGPEGRAVKHICPGTDVPRLNTFQRVGGDESDKEEVDVMELEEKHDKYQYESLHRMSSNLSYSRGGVLYYNRKTMFSGLRETSQHLDMAKIAIRSQNTNTFLESPASGDNKVEKDKPQEQEVTPLGEIDLVGEDIQEVSSVEGEEGESNGSAEQWTPIQHSLFTEVNYCLQELYLQRLSTREHPLEPIIRRLDTEKYTEKVRAILTRYEWNERLTSWLHSYFLELLDKNILPIYLDVLQTLHNKCPLLTQAMLGSTVRGETGVGLQLLLSRVWDPALGGIRSLDHSISKFESSPTFIIIPSCNFGGRARWYMWRNQLQRLGKIRQCCLTKKVFLNKPGIVKVSQVTKRIFKIVYTQIRHESKKYPDNPIILVGWGAGGVIGARLLHLPAVTSLICLDYQTRGWLLEPSVSEDPLYQASKPFMLVAPSGSPISSEPYLRVLKESALAFCELCLVGGVGAGLLASYEDLYSRITTQSSIDGAILRAIQEFLICILPSRYQLPFQLQTGQGAETDGKPLKPSTELSTLKSTQAMTALLKFCKSRSLSPSKKHPRDFPFSNRRSSDKPGSSPTNNFPTPPPAKRARLEEQSDHNKSRKKSTVVAVTKIPTAMIRKLSSPDITTSKHSSKEKPRKYVPHKIAKKHKHSRSEL